MSLGHICLETIVSILTIPFTGGEATLPTDCGLPFGIDHALSTLPKHGRVELVLHEKHKVI